MRGSWSAARTCLSALRAMIIRGISRVVVVQTARIRVIIIFFQATAGVYVYVLFCSLNWLLHIKLDQIMVTVLF